METFGWTSNTGDRIAEVNYGEGVPHPYMIVSNHARPESIVSIPLPTDENGKRAILVGFAQAMGIQGALVEGDVAEQMKRHADRAERYQTQMYADRARAEKAEEELAGLKERLRILAGDRVSTHEFGGKVDAAIKTLQEVRGAIGDGDVSAFVD